jgi:hypothetical protein
VSNELALAEPTKTIPQVRAELERARARFASSAHALRDEVAARTDYRVWVRERPYLFVLGAFALGLYFGLRKKEGDAR